MAILAIEYITKKNPRQKRGFNQSNQPMFNLKFSF
jgi:hypothetical protein